MLPGELCRTPPAHYRTVQLLMALSLPYITIVRRQPSVRRRTVVRQLPPSFSPISMRFSSSSSLFLLWATLVSVQVRCDVPYPGPEWTDTLFIDDFSGSKGSLPDGATWMLDTGTSYPGGPPQWGTGEIETYSDKPRYVHQTGEGHLKIIPRFNNGTWTSARIETRQMDFAAPRHGKLRVEASLSAPAVDSSNGLGK